MNKDMNKAQRSQSPAPDMQKPAEEGIRVDGFEQVLSMLRIADPEFRESLLRRLAGRDRNLAEQLRRKLKG